MTESQSRADRTRRMLLDAAGQIIATEGYAALSEERLCQRSGVSRGALRYHFPSGRYDLLDAFAADVVRGQAERIAPIGELSPRERVYLMLMSLHKQQPSPATVALLELWMASRGDARLAERLGPVMRTAMEQSLGSDDGDPELLALRFLVHGACMHAFSRDFSAANLQAAIGWVLQRVPPPPALLARLQDFHAARMRFAQAKPSDGSTD